MSSANALLLIIRLLGIAMLLQGIEIFAITRKKQFQQIWSDENLQEEFTRGLPFSRFLRATFLSESAFKGVVLFQILAAVTCLWFPSTFVILMLFLTQLVICIRFRGTFNGGSDMMLFVVLTGVLFSTIFLDPLMQRWGLVYIGIHLGYSYFKAGLAKIIRPEWRLGTALPAFLERSLFPDMRLLGGWLRGQKALCFVLAWMVLIFELAAILIPFMGSFVIYYFAAAVIFHLFVFFAFGLNRFFWAWLCAWPAIFYCVSALQHR